MIGTRLVLGPSKPVALLLVVQDQGKGWVFVIERKSAYVVVELEGDRTGVVSVHLSLGEARMGIDWFLGEMG